MTSPGPARLTAFVIVFRGCAALPSPASLPEGLTTHSRVKDFSDACDSAFAWRPGWGEGVAMLEWSACDGSAATGVLGTAWTPMGGRLPVAVGAPGVEGAVGVWGAETPGIFGVGMKAPRPAA